MTPVPAKRALVTGATGFIGSHLIDHLNAAGWEVAVLGRRTAASLSNHAAIWKTYVYDGTTSKVIDAITDVRPDVVFHLASLFLASHDSTQVESLIAANILFGSQIVEAMKLTKVTALVNAGTSWQNYTGNAYNPVNLYAATKQAFEDILSYYAETAELRAVTLRLYDSYGPGDIRRKLLRLMLNSLKTGESLEMSPGDQVLDLVHVDDICRAFLCAAAIVQQRHPGTSVYAVSGGQRRTLQQVVATLEEAAGRKLPIRFGVRPYREREVMIPWEGPQLPGWQPEITLLEGFKMLIAAETKI